MNRPASPGELNALAGASVAGRRPTLRRTRFAEIDPEPRKVWLVDRFLGGGEMSVVFGAPGSGKSVIVSDMACHIAAGRPWLMRTVARGAVLYVAAERAALVKRRMAAWRLHHGVEDIPLAILQGPIDLRSSKVTAEEIIVHARELRDEVGEEVRLVVIDTVSRALAGGDENSPKDMGAFVSNVAMIQEATGAHVCLIHHIPADGTQRLRGHGALLGAVDTSIGVENGRTARTATVDKQNDGEEGERVAFTLESIEIGKDTTAPVVIAADAPQAESKQRRRLPDRTKNALDVLKDLCLDGKPVLGHGLPAGVKGVDVEVWREQLYQRGTLDADHKNPREDFRRVKDTLLARGLAAIRDGQIWAA